MSNPKLYIKNMVCNRCIMVVESELKKLGIEPVSVELGEVSLSEELTEAKKQELVNVLQSLGFDLLDNKKGRLIEQIKNLIIERVRRDNNKMKTNLSGLISEKTHHDYNYMSKLFSEIEGTTIEQYFIAQKIERVKELLVYDELTLSEIAFQLNYSSVAHLSAQFKKVTGLTPSHFKMIKENKRTPLDKV